MGSKETRKEISQKRMGVVQSEYLSQHKKINLDSLLREEIHTTIIRMISEGKGKIETLIFLNNKYPDYKFSEYFEKWYVYHSQKKETKSIFIRNHKKTDYDEER